MGNWHSELRIGFCFILVTITLMFCMNAWSFEPVQRRKDQFGKDFSYFIYPIAGDIPGLGKAAGLGATILNIKETDLDFTGFNVDGDFSASGYTFLDYHLLKNRVTVDFGVYDFDVAPTVYNRGIDSSKDEYFLPRVEGEYIQGQVTLTFDQRRYETYIRIADGSEQTSTITENDGVVHAANDTSKRDQRLLSLGAIYDNTDDRLDPRTGFRVEFELKKPAEADPLMSRFFLTDYNLTGYLPLRRWDTLAFNAFFSDAHVTHESETNADVLLAERVFDCTLSEEPEKCQLSAERRVEQIIDHNRHGTATSLGGTQRLRSFSNYRYYAGSSFSYGMEYRWNLTDEHVPFNIYVAKGIRTGFQLAFFAEQGSVAEHAEDLLDNLKTSYGMGFRLVLSGVIIRADIANGSEGEEFILFINYPWSMFSVDG